MYIGTRLLLKNTIVPISAVNIVYFIIGSGRFCRQNFGQNRLCRSSEQNRGKIRRWNFFEKFVDCSFLDPPN